MAVNKGLIGIDEFGELIVREGENLEGIIDIVRHKSMAYRIGGDEMLVAKIHDTDCIKSIQGQDWAFMETIRTRFNKHISESEIFQGTKINISIGSASSIEPRLQNQDIGAVQEIADQRLYADKNWSKGMNDSRAQGATRREVHDNMFNNFNSYYGPENRAPRPQDELGNF